MIPELYNNLKSWLYRSEYGKNILSVFTANTIAQFLPLISAPILTRIYTPADYGVLGVIMSITGLLGVFITLSYSNAIIISDSDPEVDHIIGLCLKLILLITVISMLILIFFRQAIARQYQVLDYSYWFYIIPVLLFLNGMNNMLASLVTRWKYFKALSINKVIMAVTGAVLSIGSGLIFRNTTGLLLSFFVSIGLSNVLLLILLRKNKKLQPISFYLNFNTKNVVNKYRDFPQYVLPAEFINSFSNQIPIFMLSSASTSPQTAVGHYNMSNRILGLPIGLISTSIGDVFKQRAANDYNEAGDCRPIFVKTFKALLITSLFPFAILIFFGSDIFAIVFGEKWRGAGHYSQILGIMFFFRFIISPLTYVFYIARKQRLDFVLHLLFIVFGFVTLYVGIRKFNNIDLSLWMFSVSYSCLYLIYFYFSYKFSLRKPV
ncbi:MAG: oligosaccharide flippase family protein [Saprospiraceae bacterium]|nr:oligosaccharide flippase family protein [Saprospiraceae bacterium]